MVLLSNMIESHGSLHIVSVKSFAACEVKLPLAFIHPLAVVSYMI